LCQQKEKVQYKNKDKYLYTFLSRKVEGLGPMKPWQPTHLGKVPLPSLTLLEIDKLQIRTSYTFYIKRSSSTCLEERFFVDAHLKKIDFLAFFSIKMEPILLNTLEKKNYSMSNKILKLGIFGFGCVGQGLHNVLSKTKGINATIEKICIKHPNKKRSLDAAYFTTNPSEILDNPEIDVVVELIDDSEAAYHIVKEALTKGKAVVSANKKLIAEHLEELLFLQSKYETPLLYEGSVCGSIPVIRNLEEYYDNDLLSSVSGIFNGSTNYILSKMKNEGLDFEVALKEAQDKGFAESDPILDVGGFDAKYKLCITLLHAFGLLVRPENILNIGIQNLSDQDVHYATQNHKSIKLVVHGQKQGQDISAFVMPTFVSSDNPLTNVHNEFNGILMESAFANQQFFGGKGAGSDPTGSAVLSDISALTYGYKYEYKKLHQSTIVTYSTQQLLEVYVRYQDKNTVQWEDFETISQRFESKDYNYVIGSVYLEKLLQEEWALNDHISIVLKSILEGETLDAIDSNNAAALAAV